MIHAIQAVGDAVGDFGEHEHGLFALAHVGAPREGDGVPPHPAGRRDERDASRAGHVGLHRDAGGEHGRRGRVHAVEVALLAEEIGIAARESDWGLDQTGDLHRVVAVAEEALTLTPDGGHF